MVCVDRVQRLRGSSNLILDVDSVRRNIKRKLDISSTANLIRYAIKNDLVSVSDNL
jgi:hypothetical protein